MRILLHHNYYQQAGGDETVVDTTGDYLKHMGVHVCTVKRYSWVFGGSVFPKFPSFATGLCSPKSFYGRDVS